MYSFEPSDEQKMLRDAINRFAMNDLRPAARPADESGELPRSLLGKGWELGLVQASIPAAYGGFGERSAVTGALAAEELAFGDLSAAFAVGTPGLFAFPILLAGSEEQKRQYLPKIAAGEWQAFTAGLIEYDFDFDPQAITDHRDPAGWRVSAERREGLRTFCQRGECVSDLCKPGRPDPGLYRAGRRSRAERRRRAGKVDGRERAAALPGEARCSTCAERELIGRTCRARF